MKILTLTDDLPPAVLGGSGRIAWETSTGLRARGHDVTILTAAPDGAFPASIQGVSIRTLKPLPKRWAHYRSVFSRAREREILAVIDAVQPDLIHAHGLAWQLGYRWIGGAKQRGIPVVHTLHGVMSVAYGKVFEEDAVPLLRDLKVARWTYNPLRNVLAKRALQYCTLVSVSDALKGYLERCGYRNIVTLHNGIDAAFWSGGPSREEARMTLKLPPEKTIFLFAGRIGHDKGMTVVRETLPADALLLAAGDGDGASWESLGAHVRFFPKQNPEQMRTLYAAASVTLAPSLYLDPFPTVCLESMLCGTPVLATSRGGSKEAVVDGVTGWIADPQDTAAFAEKMRWCATHPAEVVKAGEEAKKHAQALFSREMYLDRLEEIYADAAPKKGRG